jgi:acetoin utilization protein AcuB
VGEAWELLRQGPFRHLPVVENGLLVGIVSERDLKGAASDEARLRDIMTRTVYVLSPDTTVREAARRFRRWRVGAMPVLDGRRIVGMVSVLDVLSVPAEQPKVQGE